MYLYSWLSRRKEKNPKIENVKIVATHKMLDRIFAAPISHFLSLDFSLFCLLAELYGWICFLPVFINWGDGDSVRRLLLAWIMCLHGEGEYDRGGNVC